MGRYEIIETKASKNSYEIRVRDLNDGNEYSAFFTHLFKSIEEINKLKNEPRNITFAKEKMFDLKREDVYVRNIPNEIDNDEFYLTLLASNGLLLAYFDEEDITLEMCVVAVKSKPFALRNVPSKYKIDELIDLAITLNGNAIQFVPENQRTKERLMKAFENSPRVLRFFKEDMLTVENCVNAVVRDPLCLQYVPEILFLDVYQKAIVERGVHIPRRGEPGVKISTAEKYRDIVKTLDRLMGSRETRLAYLKARETQLLQELDVVRTEISAIEGTKKL